MSFTLELPGGILNKAGGPVDELYCFRDPATFAYRDYATKAEAMLRVPVAARPLQTVRIAGLEHWWVGGSAVSHLLLKSDERAVAAVAVRVWKTPDPVGYALDEQCRHVVGGSERFWTALKVHPAGAIPEPVLNDTVNWREASPPGSQVRTALGLSVPEARIYAGEPDAVTEGIDYRVFRGAAGDIVLRGMGQDVTNNRPARFAPTGLWQNPVTLAVEVRAYDLATDTVTLANPWRYIGNPASDNIARGAEGSGIVYGTGHNNNAYGTGHGANTYGNAHYNNAYGNDHYNNAYGNDHDTNSYGTNHTNNIYGSFIAQCTFGNTCSFLQVGANCTRVKVTNCQGTAAARFVIPAGSTDVEYRNNALVTAGGSDPLKQDKALTGYAIGTGTPTAITATETVLVALGKLEKRAGDNAAAATTNAGNITTLQGQATTNATNIAANTTRIGAAVLATAATNLSAAINEVRSTLPSTAERTASFTLALADAGGITPVNSATAVVATVPLNSAVPYPLGTILQLVQTGAGQITFSPAPTAATTAAGAGVVTIRHADAHGKTAKPWAEVGLRKRGTDEWVLTGYTAL